VYQTDDDLRRKPNLLREMTLVHELDDDHDRQAVIDSLVISPLWLLISKRRKSGSRWIIYAFSHDGRSIPNGRYAPDHPLHALTIDPDENLLWSLDERQHALVSIALPARRHNAYKLEDIFSNRATHIPFSRPLTPACLAVNKHVVAVLDPRQRTIHVYNKRTREKSYDYLNMYASATHFCWTMAVFPDDSLLIRLDEIGTLKLGPAKHTYLHIDATNDQRALGMIEEIDAYGTTITTTGEILLGLRYNAKGVVKCYA
jgi:hypothetical protein